MSAREQVVPFEDLTADDHAALGWVVSTGHDLGSAIVERARSGGSGVTERELSAARQVWASAGRPPLHQHRTAVTFRDGTAVTGVSYSGDDPYVRDVVPSFGLYLDSRWAPPWPHELIDWPDFGVPDDLEALHAALLELLARARRGQQVEIGCLGGHGRTGTALACLAVLTGTPPADAVAWVRDNYCSHAVETAAQAGFVRGWSI